MHMGGGALALTIDTVFEQARRVAATLLRADQASLSYEVGRFTVPKQPLEHHAWVVLAGNLGRRTRPRQCIDERAGGVIACTHQVEAVEREFERSQLCVLSELLGRDLIDRGACFDPIAGRAADHASQEPR